VAQALVERSDHRHHRGEFHHSEVDVWLSAKALSLPKLIVRWRIAYAILVVAVAFAFFQMQEQAHQACRDRVRQYDAVHKVIDKAYTSQRPSPALLNAFPQLAPFYTPGNPQYDEQQHALREQRSRLIAVLGDRPSCR
jgi:hypothetical protein